MNEPNYLYCPFVGLGRQKGYKRRTQMGWTSGHYAVQIWEKMTPSQREYFTANNTSKNYSAFPLFASAWLIASQNEYFKQLLDGGQLTQAQYNYLVTPPA